MSRDAAPDATRDASRDTDRDASHDANRDPSTSSPRSKVIATWLAILGGSLGLHRFYLRGPTDRLAWLHVVAALIGGYGFLRLRDWGIDDWLGSALVPLLGLSIAAAMLAAIVYGLMPGDQWRAKFGGTGAAGQTSWATVTGAALALALGATAAVAAIAFAVQRFFEWQVPA